MPDSKKDTEFNEMSSRIDELFSIIKAIRPLKESEIAYFYNEFSISTSHNSNAIEGNTFTYDETRLLLKEGIASSKHDIREHNEILGYKKGFDFLYDEIKKDATPTQDLIKKIHSYVMMGSESAGEYRSIQNYIGDMFSIAFTPCDPGSIEKAMSDYVEILSSDIGRIRSIKSGEDIDWIEIFSTIARNHISFERIHPFIDGNGRTGRLILTFELISSGLLPIDIRYDESASYYSAFKEFDRKINYSMHPENKMAKLMMKSEIRSMEAWIRTFDNQ